MVLRSAAACTNQSTFSIFSDAAVEAMLPLAQEYQMSTLTRQCEAILLSAAPCVRSLVLAETYQLVKLRPKCLGHLKSYIKAETLTGDPYYRHLSNESKAEILKAMALQYERTLSAVHNIAETPAPERFYHQHFAGNCDRCRKNAYSRISKKIRLAMGRT